MYRWLLTGLFIFFGMFFPGNAIGQKKIMLEKTGKFRHYFYEMDDHVRLKPADSNRLMRGTITGIYDSSLILNSEHEFLFKDIEYFSRPRGGFLFLKELFLKAGIPFFLIVGINRTINHEYPIFDELAIYVGGGLILAGVLISPLSHKRIKPGKKGWQLKILDFDAFY